jgi:mono/diheme cytochrome c family protein
VPSISGPLDYPIEPGPIMPASPALLETGKATYARHCAGCHGPNGDGMGEAAYLLYPRPRDFTMGQFRLVSTWDNIPTDADLYRTISRGMPGSAMPSWAHLSEATRWGLVHFVKTFSKNPLVVRPEHDPASLKEEGKGVIRVPPEPPYDESARLRAQSLYLKGCAPCHGVTGKGDGQQRQEDSKGFPTRPRDLTAGIFKGSPEPEQVYRRLVAGLPGSPMPQNPYLHGPDGWHLTHYVRELSSDEQRARVEMKVYRIVARRVEEVPTHPDSGQWLSTPAINLHLMPLWWRSERPEELTVKALHDGNQIAILLSWSDGTHDHTAVRPQDFRDAAAIEFSLSSDPPFFAMGELGGEVNIWMWKSERQADLEPVFQDLEKVYPNIGIDSYPNLQRSPIEQMMRNALTLESDPAFVTAWGAGNIVADPTRRSSAEDLRARGFGSLRARPRRDQSVEATGIHSTGTYQVVFRRSLRSGSDAVPFQPGSIVPAAFAVWNGSAGDRDGKKSVTIWQELFLER